MARYLNLLEYNYNGKRIKFTPKYLPPSFFTSFLHTMYQVTQVDTLDKIAFEYYDGHAEYDWIIKMANGLDLPTDLNPGDMIMIPLDYKSVLQAIAFKNAQ